MMKFEKGGAAIGIDLGATTSPLGIVFHNSRRILRFTKFPTLPEKGPEDYVKRIAKNLNGLGELYCQNYLGRKILGVGLGIPSWNGEKKMIMNSPNMPLFNDFPLIDALEKACPQWEGEIRADNDANVAGDAEVLFGGWEWSGQGINVFTLGGGVGFGGYVYDSETDRLIKVTGEHYRGGEGGHIPIPHPPGAPERKCGCGYSFCLEAYASATAVTEFAKMAITPEAGSLIDNMVAWDSSYDRSKRRIDQVNPLHVEQAAAENDKRALEIQH